MSTQSIIMGIQIIALVVLFINLLFVVRQEASSMQNYLIILLISTILMFVGYIMEIRANSLECAELGAAAAYLGKPFIMLYSAMFICAFYGFKVSSFVFHLLNVFCTSFYILVYTNSKHHLYYGTTAYDGSRPFSPLITTQGSLYFTYIVTAVLFFVACLILIIRGYLKNKTKENLKISLLMSLMVVCGILGYATYLGNVIKGYDTTILGVFGSVICLSVMFFKYRIFDVLSFAKNEALMDSSVGLVVLNQSDSVLYSNYVGSLLMKKVGLEILKKIDEKGENIFFDGRVYSVKTKLFHMKNQYYGKSIEASDITISFNYQQQLEHDVEERTQQIENIQREIIGSLASIVEARSFETGEHIVRTREYVELTAKALKKRGLYANILTDSYITLLSEVAPLHDIGKITTPDSVLNKPGKLTAEEYEIIKNHTKEGAIVIEKTMRGVERHEYVEMAIEIALYHHEWYDGSGYPAGLKGKDIPLAARIMALADSYDALISKRVYKPPFTKEQAINIIKEESGTHFDPDVVEAFLSAASEL